MEGGVEGSFLDASETRIQDAELAVVMCLGGRPGVVRDTNPRWEASELGVKPVAWATEGCDLCVSLTLDSVLKGQAGTRANSDAKP